ncbi:MAG: hypothetical protein N2260_02220 [Syntrophobacterales bacterium]|nr:hypothetical protein [Syntrophobacterales bacterium]
MRFIVVKLGWWTRSATVIAITIWRRHNHPILPWIIVSLIVTY